MRRFHYPVVIAIAAGLFAAVAISTPAAATDARQAIKLCEKNPNCTYGVLDNGSVILTVDDNVVECPQVGECACSICEPPAIKTGGKVPKVNVQGVLTAMPAKARPRPKATVLPDGGILQRGPGFGTQGPAAAGAPLGGGAAPAAPPVPLK